MDRTESSRADILQERFQSNVMSSVDIVQVIMSRFHESLSDVSGGGDVTSKQHFAHSESDYDRQNEPDLEGPTIRVSNTDVEQNDEPTYIIANMKANCRAARPAYTIPRRISCEGTNGGIVRRVIASFKMTPTLGPDLVSEVDDP